MYQIPPISFVKTSAWRRAATLVERVEAYRVPPGRNGIERDAERGRRRLEEWRGQEPFPSAVLFQQRLAQAGLTEEELLGLLSESNNSAPNSPDPNPPGWAAAIDSAYALAGAIDIPPYPDRLGDRPEIGLLEVVRPLITQAVVRLRKEVQALGGRFPDSGQVWKLAPDAALPFDPETVEGILLGALPNRLLAILLRTLTLELQVARLQGLLHGETAEARFQSFIDHLRQPATALELLREYPVLARQVVLCLDNWLAASLEFLQRWCADWPLICATFSPHEAPGPLASIQTDAGDSHRGGRSVLIAQCRSGFQVVYKPKSLTVDEHFQELLGWLNERGASPPFRQIKILDRGRYGWVEFVSPGSCASAEEIERFYRREGGFLALLYALAAMDFHYENVIAAGEHPVLIDLEALFHPQEQASYVKPADHLAGNALDESVLGTGLLPQPIRVDFDGQALDLSGMAAEPGRDLPWRYPGFTGQGTDEMHFVRETDIITSADHRPSLKGATVQPLDYAPAIEAGFRHVYKLLEQHRAELLAANGPLERFAADEVRVILRPTSYYREFLDEAFHPDVLRDALDRDRLFDRLWDGVDERPRQIRFIPAEMADLWRGDIPFFTTRPDSRDLWGSAGQRFADEFRESALEQVHRRLAQLDDSDLKRQLWFLRASLTTLTRGTDTGAHPGYQLMENGAAVDLHRLLAASCAVGDWLAEHAIHGPAGDVNWVGLTLVRDEQWSLLPLGMDLYDGVPGVTLFLAHLGAITGEQRYTALARAALKTLRRRLQPHKRLKTVRCLGGFAGWGGVLYTLAHLGALWHEPEIFSEAQDLVAVLPDLIEQDKYFDIGLGAAGCIAGLVCLYGCAPSGDILTPALQCGDHLLARARSMPQGIGWDWPWPSRGPLTGYSHGAAGIALALIELAALTDEERFRPAARAAMDYERSLFSAEPGNWPDLRLFGTSPEEAEKVPLRYPTTWCYGAPGIGLARLRCLSYGDDVALRDEIDTALRTTLMTGFGLNHILCHGDLGNLELLLCAAQAFPESAWGVELERLTAAIVRSIERDGWLCANPMNLESPGLMTGLAGIGYQLLRLAEPGRVPSVLTLAPPTASSAIAQRQRALSTRAMALAAP
jgi:type 2 lantibiotic biosynthesis protein LanM